MALTYLTASGKDIAELVEDIEDVLAGKPSIQVTIACIIVAALAQNPDVAPERLQDVVKGVSEYMAASLFDEPGLVN